MATDTLNGRNIVFPIYNEDGTPFHNLVLRKSVVDSIVMSLGDKITGDVFYKDNTLSVTMHEYITYNGVNYILVNPPTIVREGVVSDNSELKGMTKYSFVFYHPMCLLGNFPFSDVAVTSDQTRYLSEGKKFSWIGYPDDYIAKLNKNLEGTEWIVEKSSRFPQEKDDELSPALPFDDATIADALKVWYDTWKLPYIVDKVSSTEAAYAQGKRFKVVMGLASNEIYASESDEHLDRPFVFKMGKGVGLKNNSRTPRNNKIVTRIAGRGSEDNVPYGYPQIRWYGDAEKKFTYGDHAGVYRNVTVGGHIFDKVVSYPIYKGILGGAYVELIKHPFTRKNLMPSVYRSTVFNKISFLNEDGTPNVDYNPDIELIDFYDASYSEEYPYPNPINLQAPSYESHSFDEIKPELGEAQITNAVPLNKDLTTADEWDDSVDDNGDYNQSYFMIFLPRLSFDLYACAAITQEMQINMRSGACIGCTFTVQVDWDDYKANFYDSDGNFVPDGSQRDLTKYPKSNLGQISIIVQKEDSTFGTLMPNMYQYPINGDKFVILGISLPDTYTVEAESRLDKEMKSYMLENNVYYFDYPLKFDEAFLHDYTNILEQIRPNTIIRFDYAGENLALSVKQLTIRYGDSALPKYDIILTDNVEVVLNQIGQVSEDVNRLSSLISAVRQNYGKNIWFELANKLSRTQDDVAQGEIGFRKGLWIKLKGLFGINENGDAKLRNADISEDLNIKGNIYGVAATLDKIISSEYTGDGMNDIGFLLQYANGRAKLVIDDLVARGKFTVNELESRIWTYAGGNMVFSGAGSTIFYVEYLNADGESIGYTNINAPWLLTGRPILASMMAWSKRRSVKRSLTDDEKSQVVKFRCYEYSDNGTMQTRNWWHQDDLAFCQTLNHVKEKSDSDGSYSGFASNSVYHRRVVGIGSKAIQALGDGRIYDYVDLSNVSGDFDPTYNDWPAAGDTIVQRGNYSDSSRRSMVTIEVTGDTRGLKVYDNIMGWYADTQQGEQPNGERYIFIGYNENTGRAKLDVHGDAYIGDPNGSTYIKYDVAEQTTGRPKLHIKAEVEFTNPDDEMDEWVQDHQKKYDNEIASFDYLKAAMQSDTKILGGLVLSHTLVMRNTDAETSVMAGLNGVLNTDFADPLKSVAAWYGGAMVDLENLSDYWTPQQIAEWNALTPAQKAASLAVAKTLFRHDGSGYLADGNIYWDTQSNCHFAGEIQSARGKIGGFDIGQDTLGTNYSDGNTGGTYIRKDGYMRIYNVDNYTGLSVIGGVELIGNAQKPVILINNLGSVNANGNTLNLNTNANNGNVVNIGKDNSTSAINIYGDAANFGSRTPVSIGSTLAVSGLASLAGNIKTTSFILSGSTDEPPKEGTTYLCKGISSDMTVTAPNGFSIMASDSRNTYQSLNLYDSSFIIVYMGSNTWVMFNCD